MIGQAAVRWRIPSPAALASLVLLLAALVLRLAASNNLLWLDEIWSLHWADTVRSPLDVFTLIQHDNTHFLNTLYLWAVGPDSPGIIYRIPAVLAGTCSVLIAGCIARRRSRVEQLIAITLTATSYLLIHYSSEARGYATLVCFSLASYECLRRYLRTDLARWGGLFSVCAALGWLSHPTFAYCYLAAVYWSVSESFLGQEEKQLPTATPTRRSPQSTARTRKCVGVSRPRPGGGGACTGGTACRCR